MRRTTGAVLVAIALAVGMVLGSQLLTPRLANAQTRTTTGNGIGMVGGQSCGVAKSMGPLRGTMGQLALFERPDNGSLVLVDIMKCEFAGRVVVRTAE